MEEILYNNYNKNIIEDEFLNLLLVLPMLVLELNCILILNLYIQIVVIQLLILIFWLSSHLI